MLHHNLPHICDLLTNAVVYLQVADAVAIFLLMKHWLPSRRTRILFCTMWSHSNKQDSSKLSLSLSLFFGLLYQLLLIFIYVALIFKPLLSSPSSAFCFRAPIFCLYNYCLVVEMETVSLLICYRQKSVSFPVANDLIMVSTLQDLF